MAIWSIIENNLVINRIIYDKPDGEIFANAGQVAIKETKSSGEGAIGFSYYPELGKFQPAFPDNKATWNLDSFSWILPVIEEA